MKDPVVNINCVTKQYGKSCALNEVSLRLEHGKIYGLIGKNGAGKTTLIRLIAGLAFPTKGTVSLFGSTSEKEFCDELSRIGSLIEYPGLNGGMTAKENMKLHRIIRGIADDGKEDELLNLVGLADAKKKKVKDFSLGMKQRLGIAISLIGNPELLLLDEPVNGLDPVGVVEIRNLIKQVCEKRHITVLISSHNLPELYQTATDYIIIDKGEIKQILTYDELAEKCMHRLVIQCGNPGRLTQIIEDKLNTKSYKVVDHETIHLFDYLEQLEHVMKTIYDNGVIPTRFSVEGDTLENYFLSVIGGKEND